MVGVADPAGSSIDKNWLPVGFHWGLHIEHWPHPLQSGGSMTGEKGKKACQHITVSRWESVDAMAQVLVSKNAQTQVLIGGRRGLINPVVIQFLPLWEAGRGLEHPGGPETNRAGEVNVQMEVCAMPGRSMPATAANTDPAEHMSTLFDLPDLSPGHAHLLGRDRGELEALAGDGGTVGELEEELAAASIVFADGVASWGDETYKALGNLWALIANRTGILPHLARSFSDTNRFGADEYQGVWGLHGHMHVPNNSHVDPTAGFNGGKAIQRWKTAPNKL